MQSTEGNYELIDFGNGRKLEKVGGLVLSRPCPGAKCDPIGSPLWGEEDLFFRPESGQWIVRESAKSQLNHWALATRGVTLKLRPTAAGQIGIFPEHWQHWDWITERLQQNDEELSSSRVLSLFAYTGATSLFLASRGVQVTHVDASKPTVAWGRENCQRSGLEAAPIRWLVEDAVRYVEREWKRGHQYEGIILDPPTYGHGTRDEAWDIHKHLVSLLQRCWGILSERRKFVLLCGHSPGIDLRQMVRELGSEVGRDRLRKNTVMQAGLCDSHGRTLDCGFACRFDF